MQQVLLHTGDTGCWRAENLAVTVALKKRVKPFYSPDWHHVPPDLVSFCGRTVEDPHCLGVERAASHLSIPQEDEIERMSGHCEIAPLACPSLCV